MAITVLEQMQRGFEKARERGWDLAVDDADGFNDVEDLKDDSGAEEAR